MKALADQLGLLAFFLMASVSFAPPLGVVSFGPPAPADAQTLVVELTPDHLGLSVGADGTVTQLRLRRDARGAIDRRWLAMPCACSSSSCRPAPRSPSTTP